MSGVSAVAEQRPSIKIEWGGTTLGLKRDPEDDGEPEVYRRMLFGGCELSVYHHGPVMVDRKRQKWATWTVRVRFNEWEGPYSRPDRIDMLVGHGQTAEEAIDACRASVPDTIALLTKVLGASK